ncbi:MAG: hypothetical protein ACRDLL_10930 [Solirubrobacterales bacterium]
MGCGDSLGLLGSELDAYAHNVDEVCIESFHHGIEGEEKAEAIGEERGWSGPKIEAEIRYAWANALVGQYRMIRELGPAPEKAGLMDRWTRTSLQRARLYRRIGDAWLESNSRREIGSQINLRIAKLMADHLAEPLPFQACGKPTSSNDHERIPTGQLLGYAPLRYTAEFPLDSLPSLRRVRGVYWRHHIAGRVVHRVPGSETVLVEIRLKPEFSRSVIGSDLQLFRSRRDRSVTWIGIVPGE